MAPFVTILWYYLRMDISGHHADIYGKEGPLVVLNAAEGEGEKVYRRALPLCSGPFTLAAVSGLSWYDRPSSISIAGYSLAGLFALYALFRTDVFSTAASVSGSLWYPGFADFTESHETAGKVEGVYLSLGDREDKGGSRIMRTVGESTARVERALREKGINTAYEMNKGGHFSDPEGRLAKGIAWVIAQGVAR